jgi:hypothetical protein
MRFLGLATFECCLANRVLEVCLSKTWVKQEGSSDNVEEIGGANRSQLKWFRVFGMNTSCEYSIQVQVFHLDIM